MRHCQNCSQPVPLQRRDNVFCCTRCQMVAEQKAALSATLRGRPATPAAHPQQPLAQINAADGPSTGATDAPVELESLRPLKPKRATKPVRPVRLMR